MMESFDLTGEERKRRVLPGSNHWVIPDHVVPVKRSQNCLTKPVSDDLASSYFLSLYNYEVVAGLE